jgi:hypothetical protein
MQRLLKKEALVNKTFRGFNGRITLGQFAILADDSDDGTQESPKALTKEATSVTTSPSTTASNPPLDKVKRSKKIKPNKATQSDPKGDYAYPAKLLLLSTLAIAIYYFCY